MGYMYSRTTFFRVQDANSRATFDDEMNIVSGSDDNVTFDCKLTENRQKLCDVMERHLDWRSRQDTPLISAFGYMAEDDAVLEAERRVRAGKKDVVLIQIDLEPDMLVQYRRVTGLMQRLNCDIPPQAKHMAEYEFVFLHHIPANAIVDIVYFG